MSFRTAFAQSLLLLLVASTVIDGQVTSLTCVGSTCDECLANGCGWVPFTVGECWKSCSTVADAPCYSAENHVNLTGPEICAIVAQNQTDKVTCSQATDCSTCVATVVANGGSHCEWHDQSKSCEPAGQCNILGCGSSTCPSSAPAVTPPNPTCIGFLGCLAMFLNLLFGG